MKKYTLLLVLTISSIFSMETEFNVSSAVDAAIVPYAPVNEEKKEEFFVLKCPFLNEPTTTKKICRYIKINTHPSPTQRCDRIKYHLKIYHCNHPIPDNDTLKKSYIIRCTSLQEATEVAKKIASSLEEKTNSSCYVLQCPLFRKPTTEKKLCDFLKINNTLDMPDLLQCIKTHFQYCHHEPIPDNDILKKSYITPCTSLLEAEIIRDSLKKKSDSLLVLNDKSLEICAPFNPPIAPKEYTSNSRWPTHSMEKGYVDSETLQDLVKQLTTTELTSSPNKKRNNETDSRNSKKRMKAIIESENITMSLKYDQFMKQSQNLLLKIACKECSKQSKIPHINIEKQMKCACGSKKLDIKDPDDKYTACVPKCLYKGCSYSYYSPKKPLSKITLLTPWKRLMDHVQWKHPDQAPLPSHEAQKYVVYLQHMNQKTFFGQSSEIHEEKHY